MLINEQEFVGVPDYVVILKLTVIICYHTTLATISSILLECIIMLFSCVQLNQGQSTGPAGVDLDVMPVWRQGITGRGVVVSILDDGVDHTHPDLRDNFVSGRSHF